MLTPQTGAARTIAYFSMEIGLEAAMPTYSGGLGVLAGDTLRAAADLNLPMAAVTLVHRHGYFRQVLDAHGNQTEAPAPWQPEQHLAELPVRASITIEGRPVAVRAWQLSIPGEFGARLPVYFLDTGLPENSEFDRSLTNVLYGGDLRYRLCQEAVLGLGGVAVLRALGRRDCAVYHMNEGHSALLTLALLRETLGERPLAEAGPDDFEAVRRRCVFTVHTPVAAGHDRFPLALVEQVLGSDHVRLLSRLPVIEDSALNLTHLALFFSHSANAVSMKHAEVSARMFPGYRVGAITNGVHTRSWSAPPIARLFNRHLPAWRRDALALRHALRIPLPELRAAHGEAKAALLAEVHRRTGVQLDPAAFTIAFARRATAYKRANLLFADLERLRRVRRVGPLQIVFSGKAHPRDEAGKAIIASIFRAARDLSPAIPVVYLAEYDIELARRLVAGADLWLNNPEKPLEASGTSGMKAAVNGVPSLSTLDGWWIEGCIEGVTGWAIGEPPDRPSDPQQEAASLYDKLEHTILPLFYHRPDAYAEVMRNAIAYNGSHFSAQRMMEQYALTIYDGGAEADARAGEAAP